MKTKTAGSRFDRGRDDGIATRPSLEKRKRGTRLRSIVGTSVVSGWEGKQTSAQYRIIAAIRTGHGLKWLRGVGYRGKGIYTGT